MAEKRIMLLGANGQIGQAFQHETVPDDWKVGLFGHADLDIALHHKVQTAIHEFKPSLIINAAAMTAVDGAEKDPDQARAINFDAVANLAAQGSALDIPVIHISTDYVFDGEDRNIYLPNDQMNPLNIYGQSKMMGEEALRHELAWHVILRISSVFSSYAKNLLTNMINAIESKDELKGATDQIACPTYAPDVAKALIVMASGILKGKHDGFGTFHLCGSPAASRLEFTQAIMDAYAPYTKARPRITPALAKDFALPAKRALKVILDCTKIRDVYGIQQKPWRDGLAEAVQLLQKTRSST
jgi:dTDP-4-dehydrorhamnose reductase